MYMYLCHWIRWSISIFANPMTHCIKMEFCASDIVHKSQSSHPTRKIPDKSKIWNLLFTSIFQVPKLNWFFSGFWFLITHSGRMSKLTKSQIMQKFCRNYSEILFCIFLTTALCSFLSSFARVPHILGCPPHFQLVRITWSNVTL